MLQNADPTGEIQPDSQELLDLEEECYMMGPLIDKKLQDIDEQHAELEDLNLKILEAFQLYNNLMKESISKQTALINNSQMGGQQPTMSMGGMPGINYAAAPPSLEANSLNFANKLNSMAGYAQMQQPSTTNPTNNGYQTAGGSGLMPSNGNIGQIGSYHNMGMPLQQAGLNMYPNGQYGNMLPNNMHNSSSQSSMNGAAGMMTSGMQQMNNNLQDNSQTQMAASYGNFN